MGHPENGQDGQTEHSACVRNSAPEVRPKADKPGLSVAGPSPVVGPVDIPVVGQVETVQTGQSQEIPDDGSLLDVSLVSPGFLMRPLGAARQLPEAALPLPLVLDSFSDPFFNSPITFTQYNIIPESDAPMTLPVYTLPSGAAYMMRQSSVPTVLALGTSPRPVQWSTDMDRMDDITREGPFDAVASSMDTEDSPFVTTGLPGCPYRITSYTGPALFDMNPAFGLQLHHPRFLEFIGAPESARLLYHSSLFWVDRLGE